MRPLEANPALAPAGVGRSGPAALRGLNGLQRLQAGQASSAARVPFADLLQMRLGDT
jgi:hypothetical protein